MRLLSAMTVGSLRMMPCPRAYTSVFAVPRSIARSRGRTPALTLSGAPARRPVLGRERTQTALELGDAVLHRRRPPVAQQHDRDADRARERRRTTGRPRGLLDRFDPASGLDPADGMLFDGPVGAARPVLLLPDRHGLLERVDAEARRFERRARDAETDTTTSTDASESRRSPTRCSSATRSRSGQRPRARRRRSRPSPDGAGSSYAS